MPPVSECLSFLPSSLVAALTRAKGLRPRQDALAHLLRYMPVRDAIKLFQPDDAFLDYVLEHVRLALLVRAEGPAWARNESLSDREFRDYVLPYAFLNEKRDVAFRWRHRFFQLFYANTSRRGSICICTSS